MFVTMDTFEAIKTRRSPKAYTSRQPTREEIEVLLETAVLAPNHRMTQPWRFVVLGPEAQRAYAELRADMKSRKVQESDVRRQVREKVVREVTEVPRLIAFVMHRDEDPMTREEDYAATFMGIQNFLLGATALGFAGYIHTGRIFERPELRKTLGIADDERVVAMVDLGEPAEIPGPKGRDPAAERTRWLD